MRKEENKQVCKLAMFDMDGVLFNSMPYHAKAWRASMMERGFDFDERVFYENEGRTCEGTMSVITAPDPDPEVFKKHCLDIYKRKSEIFHSMGETPVMEGAIDVVKSLKALDIKCIVVTGSGDPLLLEKIERNYPGLFDLGKTVCSNDVKKGKPDPEPYLMGMQKAGIRAENAIVIENAPLGVHAGHASGCYTIAVNTGPLNDETLLGEGADILFHNMAELAEAISKKSFIFANL